MSKICYVSHPVPLSVESLLRLGPNLPFVVQIDGGHLILIFNAAIPNPIILKQLPKYAFKHYTYLRDKYPNCFPEPTVSTADLAVILLPQYPRTLQKKKTLSTNHVLTRLLHIHER